jgi:hypothetical protein
VEHLIVVAANRIPPGGFGNYGTLVVSPDDVETISMHRDGEHDQ